MKKFIKAKLAGMLMLILLLALLLMHIAILAGILPFNIVWGGNFEFGTEMLKMEIFALFITILFIITTYLKLKAIKTHRNAKMINIGLWIMFFYFTLNIIGNLLSKTPTEMMIFIPLTVLLSLLTLRLIIES